MSSWQEAVEYAIELSWTTRPSRKIQLPRVGHQDVFVVCSSVLYGSLYVLGCSAVSPEGASSARNSIEKSAKRRPPSNCTCRHPLAQDLFVRWFS